LEEHIQGILKNLKKGDDSQLSDLMDYYSPILKSIARSCLNTDFDVDDAVSEVWMKIYENIHVLRDISLFPAWINRIMKNHCLTKIKQSQRYQSRMVPLDMDNRSQFMSKYLNNDISFLGQAESMREIVASVFEGMNDVYSTPLKLHYLEGLSIKEISEVLNVPASTVKWRLYQARTLFKKSAVKFLKT